MTDGCQWGGPTDQELRDTVLRVKDQIAAHGRDPDTITFRYTIGIGKVNAALASLSKSISVNDPAAVAPSESADEVATGDRGVREAGFTELGINFSGSRRARSWSRWTGLERR